MASCFWVGGTGTWDGGTLDVGHWKTASGGSTNIAAPGSADTATFDANSGGGTVTVVGDMTINSLQCTLHTGTLDFASSNMTFNSTVSASTGANTHTLKWGSGTHTFKGNLNYGQSGTNLTLDVGTATLAFVPTGQGGGAMITVPGLCAHRLRLVGLPTTGAFAQWSGGTFNVNYFEIDTSNGGPIIFTLNGTTMTVNNPFHLAGHPRSPIYFRGVLGGGGMIAAQSGFVDWFVSHGFTFGSNIMLRNGFDMQGNAGRIIMPPQATAIGAL